MPPKSASAPRRARTLYRGAAAAPLRARAAGTGGGGAAPTKTLQSWVTLQSCCKAPPPPLFPLAPTHLPTVGAPPAPMRLPPPSRFTNPLCKTTRQRQGVGARLRRGRVWACEAREWREHAGAKKLRPVRRCDCQQRQRLGSLAGGSGSRGVRALAARPGRPIVSGGGAGFSNKNIVTTINQRIASDSLNDSSNKLASAPGVRCEQARWRGAAVPRRSPRRLRRALARPSTSVSNTLI